MASAIDSPELLVETGSADEPEPEGRRNRRDLLRAFGSAAAGAVAGGLLSAKEARAHGTFHADSSTGDPAIHGHNSNAFGGLGVLGTCPEGSGVTGEGAFGVVGRGDRLGVRGETGGGIAVDGISLEGTAVEGTSNSGTGVRGRSDSGTGVVASSRIGTALDVQGPARFSTSGSGTIPALQDSVFVGNTAVTAQSHITAMLTGNPGSALSGVPAVIQWVERQPGTGFVLHLTRRVGPATPFTYLIVEPG